MTTPTDTTPAPAAPVSIGHDGGRPDADAHTIRAQVARWTWIGMGAKNMLAHRDGLQADIHLGAGYCKRRLYIKLNAADLYDVELGQVHSIRAKVPYTIVEQLRDVHAEDLDQQVRDLYDRHHL